MKNMKVFKKITQYKTSLFLLLFIFCFCFFLLTFLQKDPDYYWHIKAGEYMTGHHIILKHDVFSWFLNGKYWMSHEWLFEIFLYQLSVIFPKIHLAFFVFFFFFLLNFILFFTNRNNYQKNIPFTLCWIVLSIVFYGMMQARPYIISFILFVLCLYLLFDLKKNEDSKKVYLVPILSILWANIHGGSSNLPYILILIFIFTGLFSFSFSKIESIKNTRKQMIKYFILFFLCISVVAINPHGFKMLLYPYQNMADKFMQANISEWQPTSLSELMHYPYLFLVVFICAVFLFSKRKIKFLDLILFLFSLFLGMKSIRFWGYTYLCMTYVIFDYVSARKYDKGTSLVLGMLSFLCMFSFLINVEDIIQTMNSKILDDEIIQVLKKEKPKRLYNFYDYGGYLVYQNIPVFVDGRADLYSPYNYPDYVCLSNLQGDYEEIIHQYNFDYYLVSDQFPISTYLKYHTSYEEVIHKGHVYLYKKKTSN